MNCFSPRELLEHIRILKVSWNKRFYLFYGCFWYLIIYYTLIFISASLLKIQRLCLQNLQTTSTEVSLELLWDFFLKSIATALLSDVDKFAKNLSINQHFFVGGYKTQKDVVGKTRKNTFFSEQLYNSHFEKLNSKHRRKEFHTIECKTKYFWLPYRGSYYRAKKAK